MSKTESKRAEAYVVQTWEHDPPRKNWYVEIEHPDRVGGNRYRMLSPLYESESEAVAFLNEYQRTHDEGQPGGDDDE